MSGEEFGDGMSWFTTPARFRRGAPAASLPSNWPPLGRMKAARCFRPLLRRLAVAEPGVELVDQFFGGVRDHGARREDRFGAGLVERLIILRRHHAADDDH